MSICLMLILVGSGCLLLRETSMARTIYGTYNVWDHLGHHYTEPTQVIRDSINVTTPNTTITNATKPAQSKQLGSIPSPPVTVDPVAPSPLQPPPYDHSIARPFPPSLQERQPSPTPTPIPTTDSGMIPATTRVPLYMYNPQLARRLGLSTFMMGSVLYGLSLLPALLAVGASGVGPFSGFLSSLTSASKRRRKRSSPPALTNAYRFREMPLLDNSSSYKFLSLVENTMEVRKVDEDVCRKYYMCRVYQSVMEVSEKPTLHDFELAIIDTFGVAAERSGHKFDLLTTVKRYLDSALVGIMGGNCSRIFPCLKDTSPIYRYFSPSPPYGLKPYTLE